MAANVANFSGARHGPEIELLLCGEGAEKWGGAAVPVVWGYSWLLEGRGKGY